MEGPIHPRLFDHRQATVVAGVEEKNGPWTVRVVPAIALFPTALLAIAHAIDTLTVWAMDLDLDHSVLLCGPWQMRHSTSMSTHLKHHPAVIGAMSRLRMNVMLSPTPLNHMVVSLRWPHTNLLLPTEAQPFEVITIYGILCFPS